MRGWRDEILDWPALASIAGYYTDWDTTTYIADQTSLTITARQLVIMRYWPVQQ